MARNEKNRRSKTTTGLKHRKTKILISQFLIKHILLFGWIDISKEPEKGNGVLFFHFFSFCSKKITDKGRCRNSHHSPHMGRMPEKKIKTSSTVPVVLLNF
jgi:hypothetical protein